MKNCRNIYVVILNVVALCFCSCKKFYSYTITNSDLNQKTYQLVDNIHNLECTFSGEYTWIANDIVYSVIKVKIKNESKDDLHFDTKEAQLISKNYRYQLWSGSYVKEIKAGKSEVFNLEFGAKIPSIPSGSSPTMPSNEELELLLKGINLTGKNISVEPIHFVPN
jgi:hypothetical protein